MVSWLFLLGSFMQLQSARSWGWDIQDGFSHMSGAFVGTAGDWVWLGQWCVWVCFSVKSQDHYIWSPLEGSRTTYVVTQGSLKWQGRSSSFTPTRSIGQIHSLVQPRFNEGGDNIGLLLGAGNPDADVQLAFEYMSLVLEVVWTEDINLKLSVRRLHFKL